ncbi:MAG: hypothetical protein R3B13_36990 [Polyangiaceae bacterium]
MRRAVAVSAGIATLGALLAAQACHSDEASPASPEASSPDAGGLGGLNWGGQPGTGGNGGTGGTASADAAPDVVLPDSGLPAEHAWLDDPSIWTLVPGTEFVQPKCYVFQADGSKLKFPPLTWQACGSGCQVMDMNQGFDKNGLSSAASTHRVDGKMRPLLATVVAVNTTDWVYGAQEIVDLESGQVLGARLLRTRADNTFSACSFGFPAYATAHVLTGGATSLQSDDPKRMPVTFDLSSRSWLWAQPARLVASIEKGLDGFYLDHNHMLFQTGFGAVYALTDPNVHQWDVLESNSASYLGEGEGDLAVWIDNLPGGKQRLRGWAPDGKGVRTLLSDLPANTCRVVPTPTAIVGWVSDVPCGQPAQPRLFKLPRTYSDTGAVPELSPPLGQNMGSTEIKSWGDYVVAGVGEVVGGKIIGYTLIVRLSDWKRWRLDDISSELIVHTKSWTLTDDHLYVGEGGSKANELGVNKQMRRLELSKIDNWATVP